MPIIPFTSTEATLQTAGGKGANLARLTRAGFPVPRGFIIHTDAYRAFVQANQLEDEIKAALTGLVAGEAEGLEAASTHIRAAFSAGKIPAETETEIRAAYAGLGGVLVAVRSSATAEDLPDLSFAGQQDTYLNIIGADEVLRAVVNCWSSLWTARAIGYRLRNNLSHDGVALAVVVQEMAPSEVSGVLFTANPLTGSQRETVIEATFGLGEALVSGQVEPDHYVVDTFSGEIISQTIGAKHLATRGKPGGGVETHPEEASARPALTAHEIQQLVELGQKVHQEYGAPQDIEWAFAAGKLYLLQARPITSLFPVPEISFDPLIIWFSFGAVQGLLGPITPLGRDAIQNLLAGAGQMFGLQLDPEKVNVFTPAGERLWIRISDLIRNPLGNRLLVGFLDLIEPSAGKIVRSLAAEPDLGAGQGKLKFSTLRRLMIFVKPMLARFIRTMLNPEEARARFDAALSNQLEATQIAPAADRFTRLAQIVTFFRNQAANTFPFLLPRFIPLFGPGMAAFNLLNKMAGEERALVLEVTRSLPNNVTTEMDLALWQTATEIRAEAESVAIFTQADTAELSCRFLQGTLPLAAQSAIARFLDQYGMRGVGEIDLGQPRWREDPTPVMGALQSYLNIDAENAPDVVFARGQQAANAAREELAARARRQRGGWLKEKLARAAVRRIRVLMGSRESPKFFAIRVMGMVRNTILEVGREFVAAGVLERPDDLFYLRIAELEALARDEPRDWKSLISERREAYERELRRGQIPRVLASDGRAFYEGLGAQTDTGDVITGSPVSPGVAEGIVRVVHHPSGAQLAPGEILVCRGTDPSWTPLFLAAGGLVTEVGGMMTHGSVVAREYGIPAVVGVHQATVRLKDGQRIRLDGTTGEIVIGIDQKGEGLEG